MATRTGGTGDDTLRGTDKADVITGDLGNDSLIGKAGDDFIDGGRGDDTIYGGAGNDVIIDGPDFDFLYGGDGIDTFQRDWSGLPADTFVIDLNFITGRQSAIGEPPGSGDVFEGIENYTCFGLIGGRFTGNDVGNAIRSDLGVDTLLGNGGDDLLFSGGANDVVSGGNGNDSLRGGMGQDVLTGGRGNDQFQFGAPGDGVDTITDFSSGVDTLVFDSTGFGDLAVGQLARGQFIAAAGHVAQDRGDRFLFDTTDQTLWYDRNGSVKGGLTLIADLQATAQVVYQDIMLM